MFQFGVIKKMSKVKVVVSNQFFKTEYSVKLKLNDSFHELNDANLQLDFFVQPNLATAQCFCNEQFFEGCKFATINCNKKLVLCHMCIN